MSDNIYYHYTSLQACLGILESRCIWLSDYRFLNDKHELNRALELFLGFYPDDQSGALRRAIQWHNLTIYHCVLSLSRSPKILSQWRAYGDDGKGVALGFNADFLRHAKIDLISCHYEEHKRYAEEVADRYSTFAEEVLDARVKYQGENEFMAWIETQGDTFSSLVRNLIALKNPAFEEEQEFRAIIPATRDAIKLRTKDNLIIPYTEAKFWPDDEKSSYMHVVLPEIWLGPKSSDLNRVALMSGKHGYRIIEKYDCGYV